MGYYTSRKLELYDDNLDYIDDNKKNEIINHLRSIDEDAKYAFSDTGYYEEPIKWYSCEEDMTEFSKLYPSIIFKITCHGEDRGDNYILYFMNGRYTRCESEIIYEKLNIDVLKHGR